VIRPFPVPPARAAFKLQDTTPNRPFLQPVLSSSSPSSTGLSLPRSSGRGRNENWRDGTDILLSPGFLEIVPPPLPPLFEEFEASPTPLSSWIESTRQFLLGDR